MKANLFLVAALGAFLFSSCAKKTAPPASPSGPSYDDSYTLNGDGFKNVAYNISSVSTKSSSYDQTSNTTAIRIQGLSGDTLLVEYDITFVGNKAGTYTLGGSNNITLSNTSVKNQTTQVYTSDAGGKLIITGYGTTGSPITGTFSGSYTNTGNSYTVSNGTFTATVQ